MRRLLPIAIAAAALALGVAVPALATPPSLTLSAPVGHSDANPPTITGVGAKPGNGVSPYVVVKIYKGDSVAGDLVTQSNVILVTEGTNAFSWTPDDALPDGTYTARAQQTGNETETGYSNAITFTIGKIADATPTSTPVVVDATPTPTPVATPVVVPAAKPYVCASRRDFVKHVHKAVGGSHFKVVATLNGKTWKSTVGAKQILVRLNLVGLPKDTYTLKVAVTYTNVRGKRVTTNNVSHVDYHTCTPKPLA